MKLSTDQIYKAFYVLMQAKYGKLDNEEKIKVWKISRALKPIANQFEEDGKDAAEQLKPTEDWEDRQMKALEYERKVRLPNFDPATLPMGPEEFDQWNREKIKYDKLVNEAMKEFAEKEVEVVFDPISEETFGKLLDSNDFSFDQALALGDVITK